MGGHTDNFKGWAATQIILKDGRPHRAAPTGSLQQGIHQKSFTFILNEPNNIEG